MKTQINHSHRNSAANYIFFGITLSIFLLSIFFSIVQRNSDLYTRANVSSLLSHKTVRPLVTPVTEVTPIDLKQYLVEVTEEPMVIDSWMTETSWTTATTTFDYINSTYTEQDIPVEDWMVSTTGWAGFESNSVTEAAIPLEDWMLNTESWSIINSTNYFDEELVVESQIPLESWMLSMDNWNLPINEQFAENDIPLESWMLSTSSWSIIETLNAEFTEPEIALESWMFSVSNWETFNPTLAEN